MFLFSNCYLLSQINTYITCKSISVTYQKKHKCFNFISHYKNASIMSTSHLIVNIVMCYVGAGILSQSFAFAQIGSGFAGVCIGVSLLALVGLASIFAAVVIVECKLRCQAMLALG